MRFQSSSSVAAVVVSALAFSAPRAGAVQGPACGTVVPAGPVTQQTWTKAGSPYCVTGTIQVTDLTIEPGVTVFVTGEVVVVAALFARGTPREPIRFAPSGTAWSGLRFDQTPDGSVLEHCVIEGAHTGLNVMNSRPQVRNCLIRGNRKGIAWTLEQGQAEIADCVLTDNGPDRGLTAQLRNDTDFRVSNCRITRNQHLSLFDGPISAHGAGIYVDHEHNQIGGDLTARDCTIRDNRVFNISNYDFTVGDTFSRGSGIYFEGDEIVVENCVVTGNEAGALSQGESAWATVEGAGLYVRGIQFSMRNSVVAGNYLRAFSAANVTRAVGGGVATLLTPSAIENCTFAGNQEGGVHAAGTNNSTPLPLVLTSCIVYGNEASITTSGGILTSSSVSYSVIEGSWPGTGNLDVDPLFAGPGPDPLDYFVLPASPCVDAGDPSPAFDDGCPEVAFGTSRNDIGARGGPGNCGWGRSALPYCTGKTNSLGCVPFLTGEGTPSVSSSAPFRLRAWDLLPSEGAFFLTSSTRGNLAFHGGRLCVAAPITRVQPTKFAVDSGPPPCPGVLVRDFNKHIQSGNDPQLTAGARVHAQLLQRDPGDPAGFQDGLTDAVQFFVQP